MKLKKLVLLSSLMIGLVPLGRAQITGTPHDFRKYGTNGTNQYNPSGEICIVCHAPHNNDATLVPLWNHTTTVQTFTAYTGYKLGFTVGQPDGTSKMCLSCHDGVTALNSYGMGGSTPGLQDSITVASGGVTAPRTLLLGAISTRSTLGTDLTKSHPVSFSYATARLTNPTLRDTSYSVAALGGSIGSTMLDKNGEVQCTSCHDPHSSNTGTYWKYGRMSNAGSALCLTCHNK